MKLAKMRHKQHCFSQKHVQYPKLFYVRHDPCPILCLYILEESVTCKQIMFFQSDNTLIKKANVMYNANCVIRLKWECTTGHILISFSWFMRDLHQGFFKKSHSVLNFSNYNLTGIHNMPTLPHV